jgi:hypothetical protein
VHVPGAFELPLCTLLFLYFGSHASGTSMLEEAPSLFSLLLFFFPMTKVVDGAINGDQVKGCTLSQLLLALAALCKEEE